MWENNKTNKKNEKLSVRNAENDIPKTEYMRGGTEVHLKSSVKFEQNLWFLPNSKNMVLTQNITSFER